MESGTTSKGNPGGPRRRPIGSPPAPPVPRDWHQDAVGASGLAFLVGVWLVASPFVLDYGSGDASWSPIVAGALVAVLALGEVLTRARSAWQSWAIMAIAAWLFVSGFWLADSALASWNAWSAGGLVFFLAAASLAATEQRSQAG